MTPDSERVGALSEIAVVDERERIERILLTAREMLGMQIAYFSELDGSQQVIHRVAGDAGGLALAGGTTVPLEDTYCRRMLAEEIPFAIPDADEEPGLADLREQDPSRPVAYLGVPLQLSSGRVYGTLCAASEQAQLGLRDRDVAFMRVLARLLADVLERPPADAPRWLDGDPRPAVGHDGRVAHLAFWVVATPRAVQAARRAIDCLADWIPEAQLSDLYVIVSELVTNSVRHAGLSPSSSVGIDLVVEPGSLRGRISDPGVGFDPATVPEPVPGQGGGWGLHIVRQMARSWGVVRPSSGGVAVSFEIDLPS